MTYQILSLLLALSLILLAIASQPALAQESYLDQQRENARVKQALADKEQIIELNDKCLKTRDSDGEITTYVRMQ